MSDSSGNYRLNPSPRISANQLAEYTLASPSRRQAILRNAKYAPTFLVIRYNEAREAVTRYLTDATRPVATLHKASFSLKEKANSAPTDFKKNDYLMSAEAIDSFAAFVSDAKQPLPKSFSRLVFEKPSSLLPRLPVGGVEVSVQIDLIAKSIPKETCGGILFQTSKAVASKAWRQEHAAYVATLVWMATAESLNGHGTVDRGLCFSLDFFARSAIQAPLSYKTRSKDLTAACAEIATLWDAIVPPPDFGP